MTGPGRRVLGVAALLLTALCLRPLFGSVSVLLPEIVRDAGLTSAQASWLTTLPLICLGLFAAPAPALARRIGLDRSLLLAVTVIGIGISLRVAGSVTALFASAVFAGVGVAVANVLLPSMVKRDFADHTPLMTGLYTLGVSGGAAASTAFTVSMSHRWFGGAWPHALAAWALPAFVAMLVWLALRPGGPPPGAAVPGRGVNLWRNPLAWQVTLFMGLQSSLAFIVIGWLAPLLRERGLDAESAGHVVAVSILAQLLTCLLLPFLAARLRNQQWLGVAITGVILAALLALMSGPLSARWVFAVLLGAGQGAGFALALGLIVMRSGDAATTARLSAMAQGMGYLIAAIGLLLAGLLRGWSGSYASSAALCALLAAGMAWSVWGAGRPLLVGAPPPESNP